MQKHVFFIFLKIKNKKSAKNRDFDQKTRVAEMPPCRETRFSCFFVFENGRKTRPCEK